MRSSARTRDMFTGKKLDVRHQYFRGATICVQSARTDQGNLEVLCVWYSRTAKRIVVEPYYIILLYTLMYSRVRMFLLSKSTCEYLVYMLLSMAEFGTKVTERKLEPLRLNLNKTESPDRRTSMVNCSAPQRGPRDPVPGAVLSTLPARLVLALAPVLAPTTPRATVWGGRGKVAWPRVVA